MQRVLGHGGESIAMLRQFRDFLLRGNVVDLAVAVVMGAAFGAVVTAFVADIITPIIAAIVGKPDFSSLTFTINGSVFRYGAFLNVVISFVLIGAAVFFLVVKPVGVLMERRKRGLEPEPQAVPEDVVLLGEIRDLLRAQV
jgi:large conductance mechanosensitive channel